MLKHRVSFMATASDAPAPTAGLGKGNPDVAAAISGGHAPGATTPLATDPGDPATWPLDIQQVYAALHAGDAA